MKQFLLSLVFFQFGTILAQSSPTNKVQLNPTINVSPYIIVDLEGNIPIQNTKFRDTVDNGVIACGGFEYQACFPGGQSAFSEYIKTNFQFPERCQESGIRDTLNIRFLVDKKGSITQIQVEKDAVDCPEFYQEVKRVLLNSNRWIPTYSKGEFLETWVQTTISFEI
jgi:hypothetical protein